MRNEPEEFRELEAILEDQLHSHDKRHVFLVAIEADVKISNVGVRDYLSKAIKRYAAISEDEIFSGTAPPSFYIEHMVCGRGRSEDDRDLKNMVTLVKWCSDFRNYFYNKIDNPSEVKGWEY